MTGELRVGTTVSYDTTYQWYSVGNRLKKLAGAVRTTYTYNDGNQLVTLKHSSGTTTFSDDADGNQTLKHALETDGADATQVVYTQRPGSARSPVVPSMGPPPIPSPRNPSQRSVSTFFAIVLCFPFRRIGSLSPVRRPNPLDHTASVAESTASAS